MWEWSYLNLFGKFWGLKSNRDCDYLFNLNLMLKSARFLNHLHLQLSNTSIRSYSAILRVPLTEENGLKSGIETKSLNPSSKVLLLMTSKTWKVGQLIWRITKKERKISPNKNWPLVITDCAIKNHKFSIN